MYWDKLSQWAFQQNAHSKTIIKPKTIHETVKNVNGTAQKYQTIGLMNNCIIHKINKFIT